MHQSFLKTDSYCSILPIQEVTFCSTNIGDHFLSTLFQPPWPPTQAHVTRQIMLLIPCSAWTLFASQALRFSGCRFGLIPPRIVVWWLLRWRLLGRRRRILPGICGGVWPEPVGAFCRSRGVASSGGVLGGGGRSWRLGGLLALTRHVA